MLSRLNKIWNNNGFEILVVLCLSFILIAGLYHFLKRKKGKYSLLKPWEYFIPRTTAKFPSPRNLNNNSRRYSKGETECRRILEKLFNKPFLSQRPDFLRNPVTGGNFNLELDCYNDSLRLAVEYNGKQHYNYIPFFHRNRDHFMTQKYRDDMKRRICKENKVNLIEVPYTVKLEDIEEYIIRECRKLGYQI